MAKYSKRPDGLYRTDINLGRRSDGKYNRKTVYAKTVRELENKIQNIKEEHKRGIIHGEAQKTIFADFSLYWLNNATPNISERCRHNYEIVLRKHIFPAFGEKPLSSLRLDDLQKLLINASNQFSKSTLSKIHILSKAVMNFAVDNGVILRNPFVGAKTPDVEVQRREPLSDQQRELVLNHWAGHRLGISALIMLLCGLRRGELCALQWSDIDLSAGTLQVNKAMGMDTHGHPYLKKPKSESGNRIIEMPKALIDALNTIENKEGYIFQIKGKPVNESSFFRAWQGYISYLNQCAGGKRGSKYAKAVIKMQPFTPHQLRHTYATMLYSAGVDILTAQYLLGHSDFKITMGIYTHLDNEKKRHSIGALNEYLENKLR